MNGDGDVERESVSERAGERESNCARPIHYVSGVELV